MTSGVYVGGELELFADALNWKKYYRSVIAPYIVGDVLEVGAGLGGTTQVLCDGRQQRWTCLEPDPDLADALTRRLATLAVDVRFEVIRGVLADLSPERRFDCILYIDVLEHIENDGDEVRRAMRHLKPHGHLVVLAPAHNFLFSEFDRAIGHFRRYNLSMLKALRQDPLRIAKLVYLDSVGILVSLAARFIVRASQPTREQIQFWDRLLIPISRLLDPLLGRRLGKTAIAVYRNE